MMIKYFTDGSASPNPGPGGFAVIKNSQPYIYGGEANSTNIRMEGLAILAALDDAKGQSCEIKTDSEFWVNVLTKWAENWLKNNWQKKGGIKNLDIVQPLYELYLKSDVKLTWVRGHVGTELNELADAWANQARKQHINRLTKIDHPKKLL
jgi:ribonuclease HI